MSSRWLARSRCAARETTAHVLAVNGLRLVFPEHRTTVTPTLKSGKPGKRKITYADPDEATQWLWQFIGSAKTPSEIYGRTLAAFAAQHYATQLVLPKSARRSSAVPRSHQEIARKSLEAIVKKALPRTHVELQRAIARLERARQRQIRDLSRDRASPRSPSSPSAGAAGCGEQEPSS